MRTTESPDEAMRVAQPLVEADPIGYSVYATVTAASPAGPDQSNGARWLFVERESQVALAVLHNPPWPLGLAEGPAGAIDAVARYVADRLADVRAVRGPRPAVEAFLERFVALSGREVADVEEQGVYDLPGEPRLPWPVPGEFVVAGPDDVELMTQWLRAFKLETEADAEASSGDRDRVRGPVMDGRAALWCDAGVPVSMCWASTPHAGIVRISAVYTPREHRGRGYASALVADASRRQQLVGHRCMLYTQLSNPTSNKIYQAVGYRRVDDNVIVSLSPAVGAGSAQAARQG